jgi:hypothetical protein
MTRARPEASDVPRAARPFIVAISFGIIGPLVGLAAFMIVLLLFSAVGLLAGTGSVTAQGFLKMIMLGMAAIPFAYYYGFYPSVAAGILIGLLGLRMRPVPWYLALLVGLCVGTVFTIAYRKDMILGWVGPAGSWADHLLTVFPCLAATMVCWAIVRNWFLAGRARQGVSPDGAKTK